MVKFFLYLATTCGPFLVYWMQGGDFTRSAELGTAAAVAVVCTGILLFFTWMADDL